MKFNKIITMIAVVAFAATIGCSSAKKEEAKTAPKAPTYADMTGVVVTPEKAALALNATVEIVAKAVDAKGAAFDLPADAMATWTADKSKTVTVTPEKGAKVVVKAVKAIAKTGATVELSVKLKDGKVVKKVITLSAAVAVKK